MFISPFWGYSLQKGSRVIAIIDLIIAILITSYMIYGLITDYPGNNDSNYVDTGIGGTNGTESEPTTSITVGEYMIQKWQRVLLIPIYIAVEIWLFNLLTRASKNLDKRLCNRWLRLRAISLITSYVVLFNIATGGSETIEFFLNCLLHVVYMMVEIDVVVAFKREIDTESDDQKQELLGENGKV